MTKKSSGEKVTVSSSKLLRNGELRNTVMKVLNYGAHLPAIASEFPGHSQIVSEILENKDRNDYLKNGGIHFGLRHNYCTNEEGDGIILVPMPQVEGETLQS